MSRYEVEKSPYELRRIPILQFINTHTSSYVPGSIYEDKLHNKVETIMATGIKYKDAVHIACAIYANADYLLSTDIRLLKYKTNEIKLRNPVEFISEMEV